jgi:hypothetical protein
MVRKKWCEERVKRRGEKTEDVCRQRREIVLRVAPGCRWCGKSDGENVLDAGEEMRQVCTRPAASPSTEEAAEESGIPRQRTYLCLVPRWKQ